MTHELVRLVLVKLLPTAHYANRGLGVRIGVAGAYIVGLAIFSIGTYLVVEVNCRNWMRALMHRGHAKEQVAAGVD